MSINNHPMQRTRNPYHRPDGWKSMPIGNGVYLQADFRKSTDNALETARIIKRHRMGAICITPKEHYGDLNSSQFGRHMYELGQLLETNSIY